ncbi:MAG: hypothetical protein ACLS63_08395 [Flavonifractor plautii]
MTLHHWPAAPGQRPLVSAGETHLLDARASPCRRICRSLRALLG